MSRSINRLSTGIPHIGRTGTGSKVRAG